ncbi:hypothetical protein [Caldivirga maquilingensis]|uniref:Uncharacterized protein n=1 Tax=Caldivirga maquilingensis (strain ATCC 700844 / DSM 13496 / JCM 10307 / IC-167) TaxID=397948 RepID=A8MAE4_CALMQ|nr:hypothetical protein [Caldivirga maquilingensis]ABW02521.1 conserved hypothetical protein [Caldivirga maquilingensis IC-167]
MGYIWYIDISLSVIQALVLVLMIRNYLGIGFTRTGKILLGVSSVFLIESIAMILTYYNWMIAGMGPFIALPALAITIMNLVGVLLLYIISRL